MIIYFVLFCSEFNPLLEKLYENTVYNENRYGGVEK